jgi:hypothetical protein
MQNKWKVNLDEILSPVRTLSFLAIGKSNLYPRMDGMLFLQEKKTVVVKYSAAPKAAPLGKALLILKK